MLNGDKSGTEFKDDKGTFNFQQAIATFASSFFCLCGGLTFGFSAVLLPQLKEDDTFPYDESNGSWIASISPLSMVFGCLCAGSLIDGFGRKLGHVILACPFLVGWLVLGFATNFSTLLVGRFITGFCTGAFRPISVVYLGEITDPKYRGVTLFCPSLAMNFGVLFSHIIGTYLYWKIGALVCCFPNIIALILLVLLKESPLWLISKGRVEEGAEAFRSFRGKGEAAEKELQDIIEKQTEKTSVLTFKELIGIVFSRKFLKPLVTVFLLFFVVQFCGVNTLSFYAEDMLKRTFPGTIDTFLLIMIIDSIRVTMSTIICIVGKILPRKIAFLTCCFGVTVMLFGLVIILLLNPPGSVWIAITCMIIYIALASAIVSMSWSFIAEIFPGNVRGLGSGLGSAISFTLLFISVKITPTVMDTLGEAVMYGIFASITLFCAVNLCFVLPETNGKSLQDIENSYKNKNLETKCQNK